MEIVKQKRRARAKMGHVFVFLLFFDCFFCGTGVSYYVWYIFYHAGGKRPNPTERSARQSVNNGKDGYNNMERTYNFSPGPSMLPLPVLEKVKEQLPLYMETGMSVMEMSHRSKMYEAIIDKAEADLRELMHIPENYSVLFLHGGATLQFAAVPLNLMATGKADYIDSGSFAAGAAKEGKKYGDARVIASSKADNYTYVPDFAGKMNDDADYLHITANNTIYGTRFIELPKGKAPLVADMSSCILGQPYDMNDFGVMYAGAQKNIGPSGFAVVIVRKDMLGHALPQCPKVMDWTIETENKSMINTPNTFGIYVAGLCFEWLKKQGGVEGIYEVNKQKAVLLYDFLDNSKLFKATAQKKYRSLMNVTFVTGDADKDAAFVSYAAGKGLVNLKGHRSVGGMRASIYNAMPLDGVKALVECLKAFELGK